MPSAEKKHNKCSTEFFFLFGREKQCDSFTTTETTEIEGFAVFWSPAVFVVLAREMSFCSGAQKDQYR